MNLLFRLRVRLAVWLLRDTEMVIDGKLRRFSPPQGYVETTSFFSYRGFIPLPRSMRDSSQAPASPQKAPDARLPRQNHEGDGA